MDSLNLGGIEFTNRMILGTGKYPSDSILKECITGNDIQMVTVALRRVDLDAPEQSDILDAVDKEKVTIIPNTSGCRDVDQAVRVAKICRAAGLSDFIKVEIINEMKYLLPDPILTYQACKILVKNGFKVLPYVNADPVLCKALEEIGCSAVMPLGAPIGTGKGLSTIGNLKIIIEQSKIPVIIDAGIGRPSHAAAAMEIGADAVMLNTAVSSSNDPVNMCRAFDQAIKAGRTAYLSGMMGEKSTASPSSEFKDLIEAI